MPSHSARIDHAAIRYPSDKVTVGQLRARQPELLNGLSGPPFTSKPISVLDIVATMALEQKLAEKAFATAARLADPDPDPLAGRGEIIDMLNEDYCRYGISSGLRQTREHVRAFEGAAANQAKAPRGASR